MSEYFMPFTTNSLAVHLHGSTVGVCVGATEDIGWMFPRDVARVACQVQTGMIYCNDPDIPSGYYVFCYFKRPHLASLVFCCAMFHLSDILHPKGPSLQRGISLFDLTL